MWFEKKLKDAILFKDLTFSIPKQILFGSFSPTLTAKDKERNWKNIRDELISEGSSLAANDRKKLSTVTWQYCRRSTVAKIDNRKISG